MDAFSHEHIFFLSSIILEFLSFYVFTLYHYTYVQCPSIRITPIQSALIGLLTNPLVYSRPSKSSSLSRFLCVHINIYVHNRHLMKYIPLHTCLKEDEHVENEL